MRLVKEFESGGVARLGLPYGFRLGQVAHCLFCYQFLHIAPSEKPLHAPGMAIAVPTNAADIKNFAPDGWQGGSD
jgi:hypothetical protein